MKAEDFDKAFDNGEDVSAFIDWDSVAHNLTEPRTIDLTLPAWSVEEVDREARRQGVTRQRLLEIWILERAAKTR